MKYIPLHLALTLLILCGIEPLVAQGLSLTQALELFDNPTALPEAQQNAMRNRLRHAYHNSADLPSRVLLQLPKWQTDELQAEQQCNLGLALAAAYMREAQIPAARQVLEQLLSFSELPAPAALQVRLAYIDLLADTKPQTAIQHLEVLLENQTLEPHQRALAQLELAQLLLAQDPTSHTPQTLWQAVLSATNAPPHLQQEAADLLMPDTAAPTRASPSVLPPPAITFFVAPKGNDQNSGTRAHPFATLQRAIQALREQRANQPLPPGGATIYLRGGHYTVTNTLQLGSDDSGAPGAPLVISAWRNEKPLLDGGTCIRKLKKVTDPSILQRLPALAHDKVRVADLTTLGYHPPLPPLQAYGVGMSNQAVRDLWQRGVPLQNARWPNQGFIETGTVRDSTNLTFALPQAPMQKWHSATDPMGNGYWFHLWAESSLRLIFDCAAQTITLKDKPSYGLSAQRPFFIFHLLEELDQPGEWYLERTTGQLYLWPTNSLLFNPLTLAELATPFIEAHGLTEFILRDLTLQHGQQHGIILQNCVNSELSNLTIRYLGGGALLARECANLKILNNQMYTLGHMGMHVSGGARQHLAKGAILIENNEVYDFARHARTYNPALLLEGCGNQVRHNYFHHGPSSAMRIEGNDHLIEFNRIAHVVRESDDQGALDMWGNPSYRGIVIRYNHWYDIGGGEKLCGSAGIRLDDAISGVLIYGNLFERSSRGHFGGVQIHGGHHNIIDRNLFIDGAYGISYSNWSAQRWQQYLKSERIQHQLYREVNIDLPLYRRTYPALAHLMQNVNYNHIWRNVFIQNQHRFYKKPEKTDLWGNRMPHRPPEPLPQLKYSGRYTP